MTIPALTGPELTGVEWIDSDALFLAVSTVNREAAAGENPEDDENLEDNEIFEEIESEMMKRGTLAHASIRWEWVCGQCSALLRTRAAGDFRLLLYILQSLPNLKTCPSPLTLGAVLTAHFIRIRGEHAFPVAKRSRLAAAHKIVDALEALTGHALKSGISAELVELTGNMLRQLPDFFVAINPDLREKLLSLPRRIEEVAAVGEMPASAAGGQVPGPDHAGLSQTAASGATMETTRLQLPDAMMLDAGNERGLKQSLTTVADFMLGLDISNPLSYRLRRFATWYGVSSPPVKKDEKTVIQPVSENAADSYRQAVRRAQPDPEIVQKLERSCHLQPFWIEGQYLSFQLATVCGRDRVAAAILDDTARFVLSQEWFFRLHFSDGTPFVTAEIRQWLTHAKQKDADSSGGTDSGSVAAGNDMQDFVRQVRSKADSGEMQEALEMLENSRLVQQSPREAALWELLVMECLSDWGMKHLVSVQARRLETEIADKTVSLWEPDLLKRIKRLTRARGS